MKLFALLLAFSSLAHAGPARSPDGQAEPFAWFMVTDPKASPVIPYCVRAKTPAEKAEIEKLVDQAMSDWIDYYFTILIDDPVTFHGPTAGQDEISLRFRAELHSTCRGDEDLTVFYGVENARVKAAKALYDDPLGFAHVESFDEKTGATRGILWISDAPEVRMHPNHLRLLVTHEIGHTFGVPHLAGTVMEDNLAAELTSAYRAGKPFDPANRRPLNNRLERHPWINFERELRGWTEIESGYLRNFVTVAAGSELDRAALALTGKSLRGKFEVGFRRMVALPYNVGKDREIEGIGLLTLCSGTCDQAGQPVQQLLADYGTPFRLPLGDEKLFRRIRGGREQFIPHLGLIIPGAFVDQKTGRRTEFVMSRDGDEIIELYLLIDGEKVRLL